MNFGTLSYILDREQEKLLMVKQDESKRGINAGFHTPPGGTLEDYERESSRGRRDSAIREVTEETGIYPEYLNLVGTILFDNKNRTKKGKPFGEDYFAYIFAGRAGFGEIIPKEKGITPLWVPLDYLNEPEENGIKMHKGDKFILEWLRKNEFFTGVITHVGEEIDLSKTHDDLFLR